MRRRRVGEEATEEIGEIGATKMKIKRSSLNREEEIARATEMMKTTVQRGEIVKVTEMKEDPISERKGSGNKTSLEMTIIGEEEEEVEEEGVTTITTIITTTITETDNGDRKLKTMKEKVRVEDIGEIEEMIEMRVLREVGIAIIMIEMIGMITTEEMITITITETGMIGTTTTITTITITETIIINLNLYVRNNLKWWQNLRKQRLRRNRRKLLR